MKLVNFILWLIVGAFVGWFAGRMARLEHQKAVMAVPISVDSKSL